MANRFRRLLSFGSDSRNQNIVNSNEHRTRPIYRAPSPDNFANWDMPRMDIDTLYKIGLFEFKKAYSVKTHEEALKLDVHVQGDEFLDFKNFVVVYRIYFRLMSSNLNTRFLNPLPSNSQEIILLQIGGAGSKTQIILLNKESNL